ncbi:MAG: Aromatic amino acid transporter of the HAAAP family [Candidatus Jorgensenbacteria bacterium GW2011_GWA1_48_11]|uniref:Aromatic amino acid transporter of the HAAAP family n=1 Tax=Candidatus Jorgensenbacteria bacterium GW2011_GWA1_48_11 TaxID=1618660 RepID=A0A0G1WMJ1_9BACT|nr:MAG: Aromatic amino acid transporter of the HAAAP family [Candidatus Jorgensenbacteria bacterium GW2011_GWA1_48_11]KKW12041.1 MAG: Aromatic amino acid transporter of the HAAAP family [Candidatus Jorgensenbacteria bacterium GW2011_GWB1_49_9]
MNRGFLLAITVLAGTIVGAGMFALPYLVSRLGLVLGFFYLFFFAAVYFAIHLMYARVVAVEPGKHQFFYFARIYLKKPLAIFASWSILLELLFVLTIYLILAPVFLRLVWPDAGLGVLFIFWFVGSAFVLLDLRWLGLSEFIGALGILIIIFIVFFVSFPKPLLTPFGQSLDWSLFFLPFGPILFALAGRPAISKVVEEWRRSRAANQSFSLGKAVFFGTFIPAFIYTLFIIGVLKLNPGVSPEAVNSLGFLSPALLAGLGLAGLLAILTSYFVIAVNVKEIMQLDLGLGKTASVLVASLGPLFLYFAGFKDFLSALVFTGGIFLALEGIFVVKMWRRAFPKNPWRWFGWPLYLVFGVALGYTVFNTFL